MTFKNILKLTKYKVESIYFIFRRTIFAPVHQIRIPLDKRISCGEHVKFGNGTRVYLYNGFMRVQENTTVCNYSKFIIGEGKLEIGKNCLLGEYGIYNTFADLIIGNDVITADRISFVTNMHQYENINIPIKNQPSTSDKIVIEDGTWIGMNATILAGTHIGRNCVIAAHSVVKGIYPDFCVIGGVPSRIIKRYNDKTGKWEKPC